jgi:Plasma-membrane choline transporter
MSKQQPLLMAEDIALPEPEHVTFDREFDAYAPVQPLLPSHVAPEPLNESTPLVTTDYQEPSLHPQFRDVPFAVLFGVQMLLMLYAGVFVAPRGYETIRLCFNLTEIENEITKDQDISEDDLAQLRQFWEAAMQFIVVYPERILLYLVLPMCVGAYWIAYLFLTLLVRPCSQCMVMLCLVGTAGWTMAVTLSTTVMALDNHPAAYVASLGIIGAVLYFVIMQWKYIPFAAVNIKVALTGIGRNSGMYYVAFCFAELGLLWVLYWCFTLVGVSAYEGNRRCPSPEQHFESSSHHHDDDDDCDSSLPFPIVLAFLLALYWTNTVIMVRDPC